jgi:hypothetical protein
MAISMVFLMIMRNADETLKIASRRQDVLWWWSRIPANKLTMSKRKFWNLSSTIFQIQNIILYPENTSTANLVNEIDAILTVRARQSGSMGQWGTNNYRWPKYVWIWQFTIEPKDRQDYERVLMTTEFQKLSAEKIDRARISLYLYLQFNSTPMPLLSDIAFDTSKPAGDQIYPHL